MEWLVSIITTTLNEDPNSLARFLAIFFGLHCFTVTILFIIGFNVHSIENDLKRSKRDVRKEVVSTLMKGRSS